MFPNTDAARANALRAALWDVTTVGATVFPGPGLGLEAVRMALPSAADGPQLQNMPRVRGRALLKRLDGAHI